MVKKVLKKKKKKERKNDDSMSKVTGASLWGLPLAESETNEAPNHSSKVMIMNH